MKTIKITNSKNTVTRRYNIINRMGMIDADPVSEPLHPMDDSLLLTVRVIREDMFPGTLQDWKVSISSRIVDKVLSLGLVKGVSIFN
jgi:hypothetical protein